MAICFVIMPFRPELNYFYRLLRAHIEQKFPEVQVARGDDRVITGSVLDKIADYIRKADVLIADCSGRNPNVFYELGLAHALEKQVILITSDPIEQAPADIRAFEFVSYATSTPEEFFARVDSALETVLGDPFAALYEEAVPRYAAFVNSRALKIAPATKKQFAAATMALVEAGQHPPQNDPRARAEFLIRRLLGVEPEIGLLITLKDWLDEEFPD